MDNTGHHKLIEGPKEYFHAYYIRYTYIITMLLFFIRYNFIKH